MKPYAEVIGDPIAHSKSPLIHNFWLAKLGIDAEYRATHVRPDELADYFTRRRGDAEWRGCNVTIPHKEMVLTLLDEIDETARSVGAVNTIVRREDGNLIGSNTDAESLVAELSDELNSIAVAEFGAAVIGAGGAARAVLHAFARHSVTGVTIAARDIAKANALLDAFGLDGYSQGLTEDIETSGILVNASPLGMVGMPELTTEFTGRPLVFDLVYAPLETSLLRSARARGLPTLDGLVLLIGQAALAFAKLFGVERPLGVEAELRALLTA